MRYQAYVRWLKWLTLALLAYVAVAFTVEVDWPALIRETALPGLALGHDALLMIVAVFGTTISPYLFFWQAALEMESGHDGRPRSGAGLRAQLRRIRADTLVGMTFSNLIGFSSFATAATLHADGGAAIQTSAQAAEAPRPLAGDFCFALFCLGIVGTGLLAVPVLAGSAAYAVAEAAGWLAAWTPVWTRARARPSTRSSARPPWAEWRCASPRSIRWRNCSGRRCAMA